MYGQPREQWRWNVEGSDKVFAFALTEPCVKKLIYFSTASSYSARSDNRFEHLFTEAEGFRDDDYIYAHEKKVTEERLKAAFDAAKAAGQPVPQVTVVTGRHYRPPWAFYAHSFWPSISPPGESQRWLCESTDYDTHFVCTSYEGLGATIYP